MKCENKVHSIERIYGTANNFRRSLREQTEEGQKEKKKKEEKKKQGVRQKDFVNILKTEYERNGRGFDR